MDSRKNVVGAKCCNLSLFFFKRQVMKTLDLSFYFCPKRLKVTGQAEWVHSLFEHQTLRNILCQIFHFLITNSSVSLCVQEYLEVLLPTGFSWRPTYQRSRWKTGSKSMPWCLYISHQVRFCTWINVKPASVSHDSFFFNFWDQSGKKIPDCLELWSFLKLIKNTYNPTDFCNLVQLF